jgi:hypothetical protein
MRFKSLDFMKGFALIIIFEAHLGLFWGNGSWNSLWTLTQLIIRPFGPANFIIISIFGMLLSLDIRDRAGTSKNELGRLLKRSFIFIAIGCVINAIDLGTQLTDPTVFIGYKILRVLLNWNILSYLGVVQIVMYYFRRIKSKWIQLAAVAAVFAFDYIMVPIFVSAFQSAGLNYKFSDITLPMTQGAPYIIGRVILYYSLFFENAMAPMIPWLAMSFLVSIVYSEFITLLASGDPSESKLRAAIRKIKYYSVAIMVVGILSGFRLSPGWINQSEYYGLINPDIFRIWPPAWGGYPLFLQLDTSSYIMYSFGLMSLISIYFIDHIDLAEKGVWKQSRVINVLSRFGTFSLTVFLTHAIAAFIPLSLNYPQFLVALALFTAFYISVIYAWDKYGHGKYSVEWAIKLFMSTNLTARIKSTRKKPGSSVESGMTGAFCPIE